MAALSENQHRCCLSTVSPTLPEVISVLSCNCISHRGASTCLTIMKQISPTPCLIPLPLPTITSSLLRNSPERWELGCTDGHTSRFPLELLYAEYLELSHGYIYIHILCNFTPRGGFFLFLYTRVVSLFDNLDKKRKKEKKKNHCNLLSLGQLELMGAAVCVSFRWPCWWSVPWLSWCVWCSWSSIRCTSTSSLVLTALSTR